MLFRKLTLILPLGYAVASIFTPDLTWSPIENLDDENVVAAAEYALYNLQESPQSFTFADKVLQSNCLFTPKVVGGEQQISDLRAGMNYDLEIEVQDCDGSCVGLFVPAVYVAFSSDEMEVWAWGPELDCGERDKKTRIYQQNLDDENIVAAAEYVLNNIGESNQPYTVPSRYTFADRVLQSNCSFTPQVRGGNQEVDTAGGTHYFLEIEVQDCDNLCVGAFQTKVHLGSSPNGMEDVVQWGPEKGCNIAWYYEDGEIAEDGEQGEDGRLLQNRMRSVYSPWHFWWLRL